MSVDEFEEVIEMPDELTSLKARANLMGITYHPSIGLEKLREKVTAALAEPVAASNPTSAPAVESEDSERSRLKRSASELVRIRLSCMNPNKKEWDGEIFTVGNSLVGTFKKYVPFNAEEGWHVPRIIFDHLTERQCQIFVTHRDERGNSTRKSKIIKEFAIEVLPALTRDELDELARRQAMAKSID